MTNLAGSERVERRRALVWPYVYIVNVAGCAAILLAIGNVLTAPLDPMAIVVAVLAASSGFTVLRLRSISASFSLGDAFTLSALFLYGPEFATLAVALDTVAMSFCLGGAPHRILFNSAAPSLAMWVAGSLAFRVIGLPLPVDSAGIAMMAASGVTGVVLFFLLDSGLVATAVALNQGAPIGRIWRDHFAGLWVSPAAGGYVGLLVALLKHEVGPLSVLAVLPLPVIVYHMFRTSLARSDDQLHHLETLNRTYASTIEAFATAVDAKDQVTHGHLRRVQLYALGVARELGLDDQGLLRSLEAAALLHDVGKIGVPEHILNKPGKLSAAEFEEMKKHVTIGVEILSAVDFPFPVVPIVRHHHENWDGTGYPDGIAGTDIPIGARILMVVDCFDALTSDRPYRSAMSCDEAFDILRARRGRMYDAAIVDLFIAIQPRLSEELALDAAATPPAPPMARPTDIRLRNTASDATPSMAEPLARLVAGLLGDCLAVVYELDAKGSGLVAVAACGPHAKDAIGHRLEVGHGVSGWAWANDRAVDDTDAVLDLGNRLQHCDVTSLSCTSVPVIVEGRRAVIAVYGPRASASSRLTVVRSVSHYLHQAGADARRLTMALAS
jgi:putative nucleotidyltransferase with HDIG domain